MDAGPETGDDDEVVGPEIAEPAAEHRPDDRADQGGSHGLDRPADGGESHRQTLRAGKRRPAVTRRDEDADDEADSPGVLSRSEPLEPQAIDAENAAFVLLGVGLVIGVLLLAIAGF